MDAAPTPGSSAPTAAPDPIAEARALVAMAIGLGKRTRTVQHLGQATDRKAALYVSTLVRHAARLLQSTASHDVPELRAGQNGPGGKITHYVIRSDRLSGPPVAVRLLVVGSDARLRCCVVSAAHGTRVWADYDVATAPDDLPVRAVLESLSALIARLEHAVTQLEIRQITRDAELDADIAMSKARIAGLVDPPSRPTGVRKDAVSEEPVRPWTRHIARPPAEPAARDDASPAADIFPTAAATRADAALASGAPSDQASTDGPTTDQPPADAPPVGTAAATEAAAAAAAAETESHDAETRRRRFRFSRIENVI
jgi:hypothetical protein